MAIYLNEVRSSRRLERECSRNVEVMWLLGRLAPDFKKIADFRRDNSTAIIVTRRAFVLFCRGQGVFKARLVALDGSTVRAAASTKRVLGRREIQRVQWRPTIRPMSKLFGPANRVLRFLRGRKAFISSRSASVGLGGNKPAHDESLALSMPRRPGKPKRSGARRPRH
jgi:hypothetical protein